MLVIIFFYATLFYKLGSGPHWDEVVGLERDSCQNNWWTNLLFINNYVNSRNVVGTLTALCLLRIWHDLWTSMFGTSKFAGGENVTTFRWLFCYLLLWLWHSFYIQKILSLCH